MGKQRLGENALARWRSGHRCRTVLILAFTRVERATIPIPAAARTDQCHEADSEAAQGWMNGV